VEVSTSSYVVAPFQQILIRYKHCRKHVKRDLEPYNCVYPECQSDLKMFSSQSQWLDHIRTKHVPGQWICRIRSHALPFTTPRKDLFQEHMRNEHKGSFPESQLDVLTRASYRTNHGPLFDVCYFGCAKETIPSTPGNTDKQMEPTTLMILKTRKIRIRSEGETSRTQVFPGSPFRDLGRHLSRI